MKTKNMYIFRLVNIFCFLLMLVSFMGLRESIQKSREIQNMKGYQEFVSDVVLPSTPRVIRLPRAAVKKVFRSVDTTGREVLDTYQGNISYYASDCRGCTGYTASGYNIQNTIYYQDKEYGSVHVVAGDSKFSFGTILRMNIGGTSTVAIVLDRGGIGFGKKFLFDMLCESEEIAYQYGVENNVTVEVLRYGF